MISPAASDEALALAPGGGRLGRLASAAEISTRTLWEPSIKGVNVQHAEQMAGE